MWIKQTAEEKLRKNPHFEHFPNEGVGSYACVYVVENMQAIIYYAVNGNVEASKVQKSPVYTKGICQKRLSMKGGMK